MRRYADFSNCPDWHIEAAALPPVLSRVQKARRTGDGDADDFYTGDIDALDKIKTRGAVLSTVQSSKYTDPGHKKRIDFLKCYERLLDAQQKQAHPRKLGASKPSAPVLVLPAVDIFGYDNVHGFQSYRGALPVWGKNDALVPYKYTFHAENQSLHNYYTEKIVDALMTETLCFYWGCPNLQDYIDPRAFVRLNLEDAKSYEEGAWQVAACIAKDEWLRRLPYIRQAKRKVQLQLQLLPTLDRIFAQRPLPIHIINLDRRPDRWRTVSTRLQQHNCQLYHRFSAIDGKTLLSTASTAATTGERRLDVSLVKKLFRDNDFGWRVGVLGCALSRSDPLAPALPRQPD